jgi:hypothetical protein
MQLLREINQRHAPERQELFRQEREARLGVREAVLTGGPEAEKRVAGLLEQIFGIQERRLDLVRREQKELATFLTPVQRAKYLELQERLRRRVECAAERRRSGDVPARDAPRAPR